MFSKPKREPVSFPHLKPLQQREKMFSFQTELWHSLMGHQEAPQEVLVWFPSVY